MKCLFLRYTWPFFFILLTSCGTTLTPHQKPSSSKKWLGKDLPFSPYADQRMRIENLYKIKLQHRGEAHITLLTPPEYQSLRTLLSEAEIDKVAASHQLDRAPYKEVCVGTFKLKDMSTWFIVVESEELMNFRKAIAKLVEQKEPEIKKRPLFEALNWQPHITLGYTHRDLHYQDGAIKDGRACVEKL